MHTTAETGRRNTIGPSDPVRDPDTHRDGDATVDRDGPLRPVEFTCPACAERHSGRLDDEPWPELLVECDGCGHRCHASVIDIPDAETVTTWLARAVHSGRAAMRCPDRTPTTAQAATAWCRRLAPELTLWGKTSLLDTIARPCDGILEPAQRMTILHLGVALEMPPTALNRLLDSL